MIRWQSISRKLLMAQFYVLGTVDTGSYLVNCKIIFTLVVKRAGSYMFADQLLMLTSGDN